MSPLWLLLGLLALTGSSESSSWGCYGNIRTLNTPGASCRIGRRYGLTYCGVRASERLAEVDRPYLLRHQPTMRLVGQKYCMDPAVIAGVLSRESPGGNYVVDLGNIGSGLGMVKPNEVSVEVVTYGIQEGLESLADSLLTCREDRRPGGTLLCSFGVVFAAPRKETKFYPPTAWKSETWVSQKTQTLTSSIKEIKTRFPTWTADQHLRGGLCAYSKGPNFVQSNQDLNCDFCNDVLARAKYFKDHGF